MVRRLFVALTGASGAIILPLAPALYGRPRTLDERVSATAGRAPARLCIENDAFSRWGGVSWRSPRAPLQKASYSCLFVVI
jgi:3-polyprenyl-4-hydroxybenzoate decarboxylase